MSTREFKQAVSENGATRNGISCTRVLGVEQFVQFSLFASIVANLPDSFEPVDQYQLGLWKFFGVVAAE